jgi:nitroreductase
VVKDRATLQKLAEIIPFGKHLGGAALGIVVVMEGEGSGASLDAGRVSQNILLAAHAHGVGSCIATLPNEETEKRAMQLLGVPPGNGLRVTISLGYARPLTPEEKAERARRPNRGRKPLGELVHDGRYGQRAAAT